MANLAAYPGHPLISVVMPVYNAERYVADAINSILAQTYPHFEFIIVDDGSTDGSTGIVREFAACDARIRPIFAEHGGAYRSRNTGIAAAQGELIAYMDADDVTLPDRFARQVEWMRETGVDICGSCAKSFGDQDQLWWFPESHVAICHELVFRNAMLHASVMLRADIARTHSYDETLLTMGDYEMWTRLAPLYRMGNMPRVLYKYRSHARQTHVVMQSVAVENMRKIRRRYLQSLFPQIAEADYTAVAHVAEKESFASLADLERAGTWLVRLAQTPDAYLRHWMAHHWRAACQQSAYLGLGCYHLYRQIAPQFGVAPDEKASKKLWFFCALRLKPGSQLKVLLKQIQKVNR